MGDKKVVEDVPEVVILSKLLMSEKKLGLKEGKHFLGIEGVLGKYNQLERHGGGVKIERKVSG